MLRKICAFAMLVMGSASTLFGADVCLVNDSDRTAIFTVVSGAERFEKRLNPKCHEFVSLADTSDDRVVITQFANESEASGGKPVIKVVDSKVVRGKLNSRFSFCFVHGKAEEGIQMDLLGYICLDVVPLEWNKEPAADVYPQIRSELFNSLENTTEINPALESNLKSNLRIITGIKKLSRP